jgi:hypothetical protein
MFFLTNMYERRFADNMSRHRLDAKIAPSKPKPACRLVHNDVPHKTEPASRFHLAGELKAEVPAIGAQAPASPPTYHSFAQKSNTVSQSSLFEGPKAPAVIGAMPFKRSNSQESGICTGSESNFSVSA